MKRSSLLIVLALILQAMLFSQSCLPEGITFLSQNEIDAFQTNYPNCTEIEGDVTISGPDITNLAGLNVVTSIGGDLTIRSQWNAPLTSLTGLDNLVSIGGGLKIESNFNLTSLTGLDNVTSIGGGLKIKSNCNLTSLTGLDNVTYIGDYIRITNNDSLTNLSGLDNVTFLGGYLLMWVNPALTNLTGLDNVTSIGGHILIGSNDFLTSLTGLDNVTSIGGYLMIDNNNALTSLSGLNNVISIGGELEITSNDSLTSLTGLDNIDAGSISDLRILDNISLSTCEVQSVCDYLASPNGYIYIEYNATGCNSQAEVEEACDAFWVPKIYFEPEFSIYPNPAKNELFILSNNSQTIKEINIYNHVGQQVLHEKRITNTIDVSKLQQGMYIIELVSNESRIREKLIIR